jgi:hypothetical protein
LSRPGRRSNFVSSGAGSTNSSPKAADDLAAELEVRDLVLADGHVLGVVDDDVGRLQQRVAEKAERREIFLRELLDLLLVRGDALQPWNRDHHREQQEQLRVLRHERLDEERASLRIEAGGDPVGGHVVRARHDLRRIRVVARQRVPVGDEVKTLVRVLQRRPVVERTDQMAEMQFPRGTHPRDDARLHGSRTSSRNRAGGTMSVLSMPLNISA